MKIGTRGSKLALIQAQKVADLLKSKHPGISLELVVIKTSGDWSPTDGETLLSEAEGGKGLFAKEIEMALMDGRIDVGVHSLKDVPTFLPRGLCVRHVLKREDPRDAFISNIANSVDELPEGSVVGTSSMRRKALILSRRPDLRVVPLRGNVDTRLQKLDNGQVDATLLAVAGLDRMKISHRITSYIEPESMLPAVCQGVLGLEIREDDKQTSEILNIIHDTKTGFITTAERSLLAVLDGSCRTPIGSYANWTETDTHEMRLRGLVAASDGQQIYYAEETAIIKDASDAHALGIRVGQAIKSQTPKDALQVHGV